MRSIIAAGLMAALMLPSLAAAKDDPVISLAKVTKWEMKYNPDSCQLITAFGKDDDRVVMVLSREQPIDFFDLQLFGKSLGYNGIAVPIELTFGANGQPMKFGGIALTVSGAEKLPVIRMTGVRIDGWHDWKDPAKVPQVTPQQEAAVTAITFKKPGGKRYRLETGSMGAPLAAMRACTTDLVKAWGYDPAVLESLSRPPLPIGSPGKWLRSNDFPDKSLLQGHNGLVRFRLDVDASGQPVGCTVLYRTNPDEFADLSCKLVLQRAHFTPALDASGEPVKSYYITNIRWVAGGEW